MRYKKILRILKRRIESVKDMNKTTKEMISEYIVERQIKNTVNKKYIQIK